MSPNNPNDFIGSLVEMAKAYETLPQVQADLANAKDQEQILLERIQDGQLTVLNLKAEIDRHLETIRGLEVAKDAAETMFLEADDRTSRALAFVKATFGNAGALIQALEPPRPQPTPEPVPVQAMPEAPPAEVKAEPEPIPSWATPEVDHTGDYIPKADVPMHEAQLEGSYFKPEPEGNRLSEDVPSPQGQSESPLPTAQAEPLETGGFAASTGVESISTASQPTTMSSSQAESEAKPQPYAGRRYYDHPTYVSFSDWLDGGGTDEDYNWRPEVRRTPIY